MRIITYSLIALTLVLTGCNKKGLLSDAEEEQHPLVKQGQAYMEIQDWNKAEESFKQALIENPYMARPNLDLATIYHEQKPNFISSIYHYRRYIDLRPESEKVSFIQEQIKDVQTKLTVAILQQTGAEKTMMDLQRLQGRFKQQERELTAQKSMVDSLKQQLAQLQIKLAKSSSPKTTTSTAQSAPQMNSPETQPQRTDRGNGDQSIYHVVSGDTLTKISRKMYGDPSKWELIFEANKDRMKSAGDIKIGQSLIIPPAQ